jgi:hypothetical protein
MLCDRSNKMLYIELKKRVKIKLDKTCDGSNFEKNATLYCILNRKKGKNYRDEIFINILY